VRYPADHKEETARRIIEKAGPLMRSRGFAGTSLQDVMREAKLTVGGFYNHFKDKSDVLRYVLAADMNESRKLIVEDLDDLNGDDYAAAVVERYLSEQHRDDTKMACDVPYLSAEVARMDDDTKQVYQDYVVKVVGTIAERLDEQDDEDAQRHAWELVSKMVGALMIARAVKDPGLSNEILDACKVGVRRRGV